jgi:VanZ family protein
MPLPLIRLACAAYSVLLTLLLLLPQPLVLLGFDPPSGSGSSRGGHFIAFTLLAVMVVVSRLPWRRARLAGALATYAVATELLQGLVPHRTVELLDLVENLLGLLAGAAIGWALAKSLAAAGTAPGPRPDGQQAAA